MQQDRVRRMRRTREPARDTAGSTMSGQCPRNQETPMPLVRIAMREGKPASYRRAIADGVHAAMVEVANVPPQDRFQILTEHTPEDLIYDASYLGIARSDDIVMIQIVLNQRPT